MGVYENQVLPRVIDVALSGEAMERLRRHACEGLRGDVLEVGFGSGRNVPHYPTAVTRVRAVDPATVGRKMAARRVAASPIPIDYIGLDGQHLPLDDGTVDHVLITWTLCTIPDVDQALSEVRRVLRPGGTLRFVEHAKAPDDRVARWQDRLTPIQRRLFGGCHLNRPIDALIERSGFTMTALDAGYEKGPKPFTYMLKGVATAE